ncbi:sensor histidine kinase N-terminal domain-containing protein [Xanthobacter autotrophicus]|uniref:sensor histidine kinase n=1 Tax=Xanthobacter autotrophicus TaxID=280 RepID=UPI001E2AD367|nr:sensor histidine kinase [Xanthobacter autotrophicus]UDQ88271.1 sensor histidine kinase N-terminal domain-containing protein [Xanthobacter autotrophicus]
MRIDSLRLQLLRWLLLPLAGLVAVNVFTSWRQASATADLVTDRTLDASVRAIAEDVRIDRGVIDAIVPPVALEMFDTGHRDRVFYRVDTAAGRLLTGYPDLPLPEPPPKASAPVHFTGSYRGNDLRLAALSYPLVGATDGERVTVVVGVTLAGHAAMVRELWVGGFGQQLILLVAAGVLVIIGLGRGLAPLMRLREAVMEKGRDDLSPLPDHAVQSELRPLVAALNTYMGRVAGQMAAQRRFVANAAHQLRTPLALLSTQVAFARRTGEAAERAEALAGAEESTRRLARLAAQLLTLSRAEPGSRRPRDEDIDLAQSARQVLEGLAHLAVERDIDLGLDVNAPAVTRGDGAMMREAVVNLVDNALRYTPKGGTVTVTVDGGAGEAGSEAVLVVEDSGPGIPLEERDKVFERFYRVLGTPGEGSGIGLSIVREVVDGAGGTLILGTAAAGGLRVEMRLPGA